MSLLLHSVQCEVGGIHAPRGLHPYISVFIAAPVTPFTHKKRVTRDNCSSGR